MRFRFLSLSAVFWLIPSFSYGETIHDYARNGDVVGIALALNAGADVNDYNGLSTPLSDAVRKGHYAAARLLITRGADVNIPTRYYGEPIIIAAYKSRADLIELLLKNGAIPDSVLDGEPVLHVAIKLGCFACVKTLIEAGADVNMRSWGKCINPRTPLEITALYRLGDIETYLKEHGAGGTLE